ncbi:SCO family protein [Fodinibius salsisoli]|uniref:SCO family protein n=1 Tax=Fodinibius salsisoli TaxID=2820877 RepID=A0ABT3PMZ6_9BACT|nr:SCO family protein [Fodinibius salsisoli]MCW9707093.1 SCO family protein [Fodinibius salsisoli]
MKNRPIVFMLLAGLFCLATACSNPDVIPNFEDTNFSLVNEDGSAVNFPEDFKGQTSVITFIFTHCPDVCPVITANMKNIQSQLADTTGIQFIEISFDPERDTPSVLAKYKKLYKLNEQFSLLTGQPAEVDSLLSKLEITAIKTRVDSLHRDSSEYAMKHSNTIYIMDEEGRIRKEYPANVVPPENVIEDLQKIR